jgi:hypothetical protein
MAEVTTTTTPREAVRARKSRRADPNQAPFAGFFDRDALRESRQKGRRIFLLVSLGVHIAVFLSFFIYSVWKVDELFGPSVKVTVFAPGKAPAAAAPEPRPTVDLSPPPHGPSPVQVRPAAPAAGQTR